MSGVWAAQHAALPFLPDARYLVLRVLTALTISTSTTAIYLRNGRRLVPLIAVHWLTDLSTAPTAVAAGR